MATDDDTDRSLTLVTGSKEKSTAARSRWILGRAKMVLAAYRKDDFANPDGFLIQLVAVLGRYGNRVIEEVTNPFTGIQRACKFPPTIAEVTEACDYHHTRNSRIDELMQFTYRAVERQRLPPGGAANLLVRSSHPDYAKYLAWSQAPERDPREWKWDDDSRGIWVGLNAQIHIRKTAQTAAWRRFTDEELLAHYRTAKSHQQPANGKPQPSSQPT